MNVCLCVIENFLLYSFNLFAFPKPIPCCLDYCDFIIYFDIWWDKIPIKKIINLQNRKRRKIERLLIQAKNKLEERKRGASFQNSLGYYCACPDEFWNHYFVNILSKEFYFLIF